MQRVEDKMEKNKRTSHHTEYVYLPSSLLQNYSQYCSTSENSRYAQQKSRFMWFLAQNGNTN